MTRIEHVRHLIRLAIKRAEDAYGCSVAYPVTIALTEALGALDRAGINRIRTDFTSLEEPGEYQSKLIQSGYPPSLAKATVDNPFDYVCQLRTGELIRFDGAEPHGAFVRLRGGRGAENDGVTGLKHGCPRGVDVRLSEIVWCADAPDGS
jgi:hypothetical protein